LSVVVSSNAQSTGGRIRGTVTDPSGGAVAGATLVLINEANGTHRETESAASGEYIFLEVPVGTYQIEASQKGFKKYLRKGLTVTLNEVLTLDIPMQLGVPPRRWKLVERRNWWTPPQHSWGQW